MNTLTSSGALNNNSEETQQKQQQQTNLCKLRFDTIKQQDLKVLFEVMMVNSQNRTIADLDSLVKILMHIQPVKKNNNVPSVFLMSRKMNISKFKAKQYLFNNVEHSEHLYIILNGKIAFYKKANEYFDSDQVIFLTGGSCFGSIYQHKNQFMAIAIEETLVAILNNKENIKIPLQISYDRQRILHQLLGTDILSSVKNNPDFLHEISPYLSLNKLPIGSFLIREGQIPKALFYISKGLVKKSYFLNNEHYGQIQTKRYSEGNYCPKSLREPLTYNLITESICEIITIPRKVLKMLNSSILTAEAQKQTGEEFCKQIEKKKEWKQYRQRVLEQVVAAGRVNKVGFKFRG